MIPFIGQSSASSADLEVADRILSRLYYNWVNNRDQTRFSTIPADETEEAKKEYRKHEKIYRTIKSVKDLRGRTIKIGDDYTNTVRHNYKRFSFYKDGTVHVLNNEQVEIYHYNFLTDRIFELMKGDLIIKVFELMHWKAYEKNGTKAPNRLAFRELNNEKDEFGVVIEEIKGIKK